VTVLVDLSAADLLKARDLMMADEEHLSVVIEECAATCGPFVLPGASPCLRCHSLCRCEQDPTWPVLATQLTARSPLATRGEDPVLAATVGAYAAGQVVAHLTGFATPCLGAITRFEWPGLTITTQNLAEHPQCGCMRPNPAREPINPATGGFAELAQLEHMAGLEELAGLVA
jgi:hypothetical protein